ncbi:hypothetical protein [Micromonospora sp. NPDC049374]
MERRHIDRLDAVAVLDDPAYEGPDLLGGELTEWGAQKDSEIG